MLQEKSEYTSESESFVSGHLVPTIKKQAEVKARLHPASSDARDEVEQFISLRYKTAHCANLRVFMPRLIALSQGAEIVASIGVRGASEGALFLEQYLETTVERAISSVSLQAQNRSKIAELGNFAAKSVAYGGLLFTLLAQSLKQSGFKWIVFTATAEVEKMIKRLGSQPIFLAYAQVEKIGEEAKDWGDYYLKTPKVMICKLDHAIDAAYSNQRLKSIFDRYQTETTALARSIRLTNNQSAR